MVVETANGEPLSCLVRGRRLKPLVGDHVTFGRLDDGTAVVEAIAERRSVLTRIDARGRPEGVAANLTQLVVVVAPEPSPDWMLVDRYLAAAELQELDSVIVWNKDDLAPAPPSSAVYRAIGYPLVAVSAATAGGLEALATLLGGQRSALVGQSGVGKSSLINRLLGEDAQAVGRLSDRRALGRHTTTAAELFRLAGGGELIDSPGVRQYAPFLADPEQLDRGYREFRQFLGQCRFDNCRHDAEPGCRIKQAVADGEISADRYQSYLRLRQVLTDLAG